MPVQVQGRVPFPGVLVATRNDARLEHSVNLLH
jgi:hypothetical protein